MPEIEKKIILCLIVGYYLLLLLICLFFYFKPPKKVNALYGYRTFRSMKNEANWNFANKIASRFMLVSLHAALVISMLYFFLVKDKLSFTATFLPINFLYCLSPVFIIPLVERKLKQFERDFGINQTA